MVLSLHYLFIIHSIYVLFGSQNSRLAWLTLLDFNLPSLQQVWVVLFEGYWCIITTLESPAHINPEPGNHFNWASASLNYFKFGAEQMKGREEGRQRTTLAMLTWNFSWENEIEWTPLTLMCCVFFSWLSPRKVHKSEWLNIKRIIQFKMKVLYLFFHFVSFIVFS